MSTITINNRQFEEFKNVFSGKIIMPTDDTYENARKVAKANYLIEREIIAQVIKAGSADTQHILNRLTP